MTQSHLRARVGLLASAITALLLVGCSSVKLPPVAEPAPAPVVAATPVATPPVDAAATSMIAPMVEKRETITATGYAVISVQNHRLAAQQRLMAIRASKLDAYRSLTEQVFGQHLDASTTVADMVVMNDSFRTRVEGVVYGAVLVSITPVGEDTYETTLSLDRQVVADLRTLYLGQLAAKRK
jgi:hypothetical protein